MIDKSALSLSVAYRDLIDKLWRGTPNKPYSPGEFKNKLGK